MDLECVIQKTFILAKKKWHMCRKFFLYDNRQRHIQSAFAIPDREKEERETKSLLNVSDVFKRILISA